jgi:tetratricopeptide (TPR) repeat protein
MRSNTAFHEHTTVTRYNRHDVLRILGLHAKQLRAWERAGLIPITESYGFQDLVQLRKLRDLRAMRLSAASIRDSIRAMRAVSGMVNPLLEAGTVRAGGRLAFRHSGATMDPVRRQFLLDFDSTSTPRLAEVTESACNQIARESQVQSLFFSAIQAEERNNFRDAASLYEHILEIAPSHAPACINLGTIHYNQRRFAIAETLYRRATEADPEYSLAFFDLGNALDELQRLPEAIAAYETALKLSPNYADAHYNLALAWERSGERRKALLHWKAYLRTDATGPWADHARNQVHKILEREKLSIVFRNNSPTSSRPLQRKASLDLHKR